MSTITVIGLGPGDVNGLPLGAWELLKKGLPTVLRTEIHPVVDYLKTQGISFSSFDHLYESGVDFDSLYEDMAHRLIHLSREHHELVYAVPGHPLMAEQSVRNLIRMAPPELTVHIGPGQSFLDPLCAVLRIDPIEGMNIVDGTNLSQSQLQPTMHTVVVQVYNRSVASDVKLCLMELYPDDYLITVVRAAGVSGEEHVTEIPLYELDHVDWIDHLTTIYVPPTHQADVAGRDVWTLVHLVHTLRSPGGCPWDQAQTHESLRKYVIEEAYEVAEAIDLDDMPLLSDELGDILLQVLLHSEISSEMGDFTIRDVFAALADKLVRRHPHVFGDEPAKSVSDANERWRMAKAAETAEETTGQSSSTTASSERSVRLADKVKWGRPPFDVALKVQKMAAEVGFDWDSVLAVMDKVREEANELSEAIRMGEPKHRIDEELGDLLFAIVNVARWVDVAPEGALVAATRKFVSRFRYVEEKMEENAGNVANMTSAVLEKYWIEAKKVRKTSNSDNGLAGFHSP